MLPETHHLINGFKVVVKPPTPKMQLAWDVPVTTEFRASVNQWMIEFFGYQPDEIIGDSQVIICEREKTFFMTQAMWAEFKRQLDTSEKYSKWVTPTA